MLKDGEEDDKLLADISLKYIRELKEKLKMFKDGCDATDIDKLDTKTNRLLPTRLRKDKDKAFDNQRDDCTVRVTNLSEDVQEQDLRDLFGKMGSISRMYLAKHR